VLWRHEYTYWGRCVSEVPACNFTKILDRYPHQPQCLPIVPCPRANSWLTDRLNIFAHCTNTSNQINRNRDNKECKLQSLQHSRTYAVSCCIDIRELQYIKSDHTAGCCLPPGEYCWDINTSAQTLLLLWLWLRLWLLIHFWPSDVDFGQI